MALVGISKEELKKIDLILFNRAEDKRFSLVYSELEERAIAIARAVRSELAFNSLEESIIAFGVTTITPFQPQPFENVYAYYEEGSRSIFYSEERIDEIFKRIELHYSVARDDIYKAILLHELFHDLESNRFGYAYEALSIKLPRRDRDALSDISAYIFVNYLIGESISELITLYGIKSEELPRYSAMISKINAIYPLFQAADSIK